MNTNPNLLLWLDFETTGVDVATCEPLEVAVILTDPAPPFRELARMTLLIDAEYANGSVSFDPSAKQMHVKSGLIAALDLACARPRGVMGYTTAWNAGRELAEFVDAWTDEPVTLAGSGVAHFDLHIVRRLMPDLYQRLTYWTLDIGPVRRLLRLCGVDVPSSDTVPHRALPDIEHHLATARMIATKFGALTVPAAPGQIPGQIDVFGNVAEVSA